MEKQVLYNLQYYRKLKGISQKEMAKKLSLTPSTYSKLEAGSVELTTKRLIQIAKVLGRNPADFFVEDPTITQSNNFSIESITMQIDLLKEMCSKNDILIHSLQENIYFLKEKIQPQKFIKKSKK